MKTFEEWKSGMLSRNPRDDPNEPFYAGAEMAWDYFTLNGEAEIESLKAERDQFQAKYAEMGAAIRSASSTLKVPAAEYVPAIAEAWEILDKAIQGNRGQAILDRLALSEAKCAEMVGVVKWADDQMTHDHPAGENWSVRGFAEALYFKIKDILTNGTGLALLAESDKRHGGRMR